MSAESDEFTEAIKDKHGCVRFKDLKILPAGQDAGIEINAIKIFRWVAGGGFGACYQGMTKKGTPVAIKFLLSRKRPGCHTLETIGTREIEAAESPRLRNPEDCPNIIRMFAHGTLKPLKTLSKEFLEQKDTGPVLIFEWCNAGDFDTLLTNIMKHRFFIPEPLIWFWIVQMVGVSISLTRPFKVNGRPIIEILHDDIKPDNVFLSFPDVDPRGATMWPNIKVGDFGLCKPLISTNGTIVSYAGNPPHCSPQHPFKSIKSELWELMHVIYQICTVGAPARPRDNAHMNPDNDPFMNSWKYSPEMLEIRPCPAAIWRIPEHYSNDLQKFFEYCLEEDPKLRPDPRQALMRLVELNVESRLVDFVHLPRELFQTFADANKDKDLKARQDCDGTYLA